MYNCFDIAKKFLKLAKKEGESISQMKLLKLTYIAHGYYLALFNKPLFYNDIQAWKYGPVIPELYHIIKHFGHRAVGKDIVSMYSENKLDSDVSDFIKVIWKHYKKFSGLELSSKTHLEGTPWHKTFKGKQYEIINNDVIQDYYKKLLDEKRQKRSN